MDHDLEHLLLDSLQPPLFAVPTRHSRGAREEAAMNDPLTRRMRRVGRWITRADVTPARERIERSTNGPAWSERAEGGLAMNAPTTSADGPDLPWVRADRRLPSITSSSSAFSPPCLMASMSRGRAGSGGSSRCRGRSPPPASCARGGSGAAPLPNSVRGAHDTRPALSITESSLAEATRQLFPASGRSGNLGPRFLGRVREPCSPTLRRRRAGRTRPTSPRTREAGARRCAQGRRPPPRAPSVSC